MDLRSASIQILIISIIIVFFSSSVSAESDYYLNATQVNALQQLAHIDILQGTNKVGWEGDAWAAYGDKMKNLGATNEAKEAYYKGFHAQELYGLHNHDRERSLVTKIAAIEISQGNTKTVREIYEKTCPDFGCDSPGLMGDKASFLDSVGETQRADRLRKQAQELADKQRRESSGMGFEVPLDPLVVILGIMGAVLIFGRVTIRKE
jgi:hypothetical protein